MPEDEREGQREPNDPHGAPSGPGLAVASAVFYVLMSLVGLGLLAAQDLPVGAVVFGDGQSVLRDTLLGAGAGLVVVLLTWLVRKVGPVKRLSDELRAALGGTPSSGIIAIIAVTSAVGEELLFRGALQPLLGFWVTAVVFGFLHGGTRPRLYLWAVFALVAGLLLGWLADWTGNLLAPILCHLTVNFFNLHALGADATPEEASP
ncbi:MAG: CPBP family intramembrane metalloprotease [Myxococcales bacterium]|nr:CPBP family intramembrane metalloprotease [Myxococcales bacterium]MCB9731299.1 CPBP family intramembrane metalloprotease [Deltaproteobacteria bacterium]